jgi:hypothetical protein
MTNQADGGVPKRPLFAHSAEAEFARILDYYGVRWEYEPRTFPLEWNEAGQVTLAFSPDFYLPDEDTYVELTTLRPSLSTIKNRKLRRMQELYPQVKIKLYKRGAVHKMLVKYGLDDEAAKYRGTESQQRGA